MNKKIEVVFSLLIFCFLFSPVHALLASWNGYVYINNSLASSGTRVSAHINNASTATAVTNTGTVKTMPDNQSYYIIDLECTSGTNISLKVWDIWSVVDQTCTAGWHSNGTSYFNLSITTLSNGNTCTYAGSCTSGYCVDGYCCNSACTGSSEDCNVSGHEGTCTSTAGATTTTISGGGGGGGGGGGNVTTTKGTTTAGTTSIGTTTVATTTAGTTIAATTTAKICETEGNRCGKGYLSCCSGLTCRGNKCAKPVKGLEIAPTTGIIIGAAVVIVIVIISVIYFTVIKGRMIIK